MQEDLAQLMQERDGYRNAYETLNAEIGQLRSEREGYRNAFHWVEQRFNYLRMVAAPYCREAIAEHLVGKPSIFVITLPKSGTVYILNSLRQTLGYDQTAVLVTPTFPKNIVWRAMADDFMRGGMVSLSHMQPDAENLRILKEAGIRKCVVHVRDPRAALASWFHFRTDYGTQIGGVERISQVEVALPLSFREQAKPLQIDHYIETFYRPCLGWLEQWVDVAANDHDLDVLLLTHDELARDEASYMKRIIGFYGLDTPVSLAAKEPSTHYRRGDNVAWREDLTPAQVDLVNAMLPKTLADRFGWER